MKRIICKTANIYDYFDYKFSGISNILNKFRNKKYLNYKEPVFMKTIEYSSEMVYNKYDD